MNDEDLTALASGLSRPPQRVLARRRVAYWATAAVFGWMLIPSVVWAQLEVNPYVDSHYEHDSNVFRSPNSQANLLNLGDPTLGDSDLKYVAGFNATYQWSQQSLTAQLEGRKIDYDHYSDLNHNEYLADLVLKWKLTSLWDGTVEGRRESAMAPFYLGNSTLLTINVDTQLTGRFNLHFAPDWRLEGSAEAHELDSPLQNYPDFVDREALTHLAIVNVGTTNLTYGVAYDRADGKFENAPSVGPYTQNSESLTVTYLVSGLTTMNAAAGYTNRIQAANAQSVSAVTGSLAFSRQLTGKTSVNLQVARAVNSYLAAGASEIDTSATLGLLWQATRKIGVAVNAGYVKSKFVGQSIPGAGDNGRVDHSPSESLDINYQVMRRLKLHAYLNKQSRTSDVYLFNFSDTIVGIEARLSWK